MLMLMRIKTDNKFNTKTMEKVCILLSCIDKPKTHSKAGLLYHNLPISHQLLLL